MTLDELLKGSPRSFDDEWWDRAKQSAKELMAQRKNLGRRVLIVITALHPLVEGTKPGTGFALHLRAGMQLAESLRSQG